MSGWIIFGIFIAFLLIFDISFLQSPYPNSNRPSLRQSLFFSALYALAAVAFGAYIAHTRGYGAAVDFFAAHILEKSLSLDNLFVILLVFSAFDIEYRHQHRILTYGLSFMLVIRGVMIACGEALVEEFDSVLAAFGLVLTLAGVRVIHQAYMDIPHNIQDHIVFRVLSRYINVAKDVRGDAFWVRRHGRTYATPALLALVTIELMDAIFAIDSIPAVFTITTDPYVVYTSNIFAVLGLRALYLCVEALLGRFVYLRYSLGVILVFIGGKALLAKGGVVVSSLASLGMTVVVLIGGVVLSLYAGRNGGEEN